MEVASGLCLVAVAAVAAVAAVDAVVIEMNEKEISLQGLRRPWFYINYYGSAQQRQQQQPNTLREPSKPWGNMCVP